MVYLGELALEKDWDKIIHRKGRCDLSLFTLEMRLLKRLLREGSSASLYRVRLCCKAGKSAR